MKILIFDMVIITALFFVTAKQDVLPKSIACQSNFFPSDSVSFVLQIQPILVAHCSPCHFPGGKMYNTMPFDKAETIVTHDVPLLRRIKDGNEKALIQKFITEQKNR